MTAHRSTQIAIAGFASALVLSACAHEQIQPSVSITDDRSLARHSWTLTSLSGVGERAEPITMDFTEPDRVSGSSGCNRYNAAAEINGNRVRLSSIAGTKMLCLPPVMRSEQAFLDFLQEGGIAFEIAGDELTLINRMERVAQLTRFDAG